jgi:hypothetical protein
MASTEIMRAGVRVAVSFLLRELKPLLEEGEDREICLGMEIN